jgi:hypothetical protein
MPNLWSLEEAVLPPRRTAAGAVSSQRAARLRLGLAGEMALMARSAAAAKRKRPAS